MRSFSKRYASASAQRKAGDYCGMAIRQTAWDIYKDGLKWSRIMMAKTFTEGDLESDWTKKALSKGIQWADWAE